MEKLQLLEFLHKLRDKNCRKIRALEEEVEEEEKEAEEAAKQKKRNPS